MHERIEFLDISGQQKTAPVVLPFGKKNYYSHPLKNKPRNSFYFVYVRSDCFGNVTDSQSAVSNPYEKC